jgi:hypothetical protein
MIQDIVQDIRVRKIFEALFALENIRGIFKGDFQGDFTHGFE